MRCIAVETFGGPDELKSFDIPEPHPEKGEVRVRVHAAGVNPTDTLIRDGSVKSMLSALAPPYIPGMDAAGIIDAVGPESDNRLTVGDSVVVVALPASAHKGAYADMIVLPAASVVKAPKGFMMAEASTLLMNALTVRLGLDSMKLPRGATLLVTGSAGAVGGYAIQLAKADGLRVIAEAAEKDFELVRKLGADDVVKRGAIADVRKLVPNGVDGVIDAAMLHRDVVPAIKDGGALVTVRGWKEPVDRDVQVLPVFVSTGAKDTAKLERLVKQAEDGVLTLRVAQIFPADRAPDAHRLLEAGGVRGRPVLDFTA